MLLFFSPIIIILLIAFSLFIIILIISSFELKSYKISEFHIKNTKNDKKLKLVFLSDFHNKCYKNDNEKLICDIVDTNPDYIMLGGDFIVYSMFERFFDKIEVENAIKFISKLGKKISENREKENYNLKRIFFSFGNHELRFRKVDKDSKLWKEYNSFIKVLKNSDIEILDNELVSLDDYITISGLSLYDGYYANVFSSKKYFPHIERYELDKYFKNIDKNKFNIIMFHKPDYAEDLVEYGFDLVLSGHNHGGLVNFPFIGAIFSPEFRLFPKYNKGIYDVNGRKVIVTSGIGEHMVKIRVNNRPEICVINIE